MPALEWGTVEFRERYGYGILTDPYPENRVPLEPVVVDHVTAMSGAERTAYYVTLLGEELAAMPWGPEHKVRDGWTVNDAGCGGEAARQVAERWPDPAGEAWRPLGDDVAAMHAAVWADRSVVAAIEGWAACMADHGHEGPTWFDEYQSHLLQVVLRGPRHDRGSGGRRRHDHLVLRRRDA